MQAVRLCGGAQLEPTAGALRVLSVAVIGGTYEPDALCAAAAKYASGVDVPACVFQWKILQGLSLQQGVSTHLINERRVPSFPISDLVYASGTDWDCECAESARHFGFINLPLIKRLSKSIGVLRELRRWYRAEVEGDRALLVYALHTPYLLASTLQALRTGTKQFLIVPDLPRYMYLGRPSVVRRVLKRLDSAIQNRLLTHVDGFILLSRYMADVYGIASAKYMVLEGIADSLDVSSAALALTHSPRVILYTGALSERYGIRRLISAFEECSDIGELWICGDGEARGLVERAAVANPRIRYFGQLPRDQVIEMQRSATLLVNPRDSGDAFTMYSFPSKTMEYLQSGTPLLMSRLKGIPDEYEPYYWQVPDDSQESWVAKLRELMALPDSELVDFGRRAQAFVSSTKNPRIQGERIVRFMTDICASSPGD